MTTSATHIIKLAERHGPVLTGRGLAEEVRTEAESLVQAGDQVVIDLAGVQAVSPSFADELFGKLMANVEGGAVQFKNVDAHLKDVARMAQNGRPARST